MISTNLYNGGCVWYSTYETVVEELYEDKKYKGDKIEEMKDGNLIKAVVNLRKEAQAKKSELEYYFLNNKKEVQKYKKLFKSKTDFVLDLIKTDTVEWLENLPVYEALINEVNKRELTSYLNAILEREEK